MKIDKNLIYTIMMFSRFIGFSFLFLLIFLSLVVGVYHLVYKNRVYPGVHFLGTPIGNQTQVETENVVKRKIDLYLEKNEPIVLTGEGKTYQIQPKSLELLYDIEKTTKKTFKVGRTENTFFNTYQKATAWKKGIGVFPEYSYNKDKLLERINIIAEEIDQNPVDSKISFLNSTVSITESKSGKILDRLRLLDDIEKHFLILSSEPIVLPVQTAQPRVSAEEVGRLKTEIENILRKQVVLRYKDNVWEVNPIKIASFISFSEESTLGEIGKIEAGLLNTSIFYVKPVKAENKKDKGISLFLSKEKVGEFTKGIAKQIDVPAKNAVFQFAKGRVAVFQPSSDGLTVNQNSLLENISKSLLTEATSSSTIELSVTVKKPQVTTEQVNNLGIKELLGRGVSYFAGSLANREYNIQLGAGRLDGILVPPGAIFSFNNTLGDVSVETGYKTAYIIKNGRTDWGIGGGVCQISTTFFRAALFAGLPIIERHPHSYRVHYYEEGSPVGLDASVFAPSWDFKFKNDTPAYILIQTGFDSNKKMLVFEIYGTSDGRVTTVSNPIITKQVPPPAPLYQDDPTLPRGQTKQVDFSAWGADVTVYRKVIRGGEVLQNDTIFSHYSAWQAIYLVGTQ